jgi:2'-phosphotransferase
MPSDKRGRGRGGSRYDSQPRSVLVSKALSRLLRHAAEQERIPIDNHGYVRLDHLLGWQKLRSMKPPVTFEEVVEVVEDNAKKRFALRYVAKEANTAESKLAIHTPTTSESNQEPTTEAEVETETQKAISIFQSTMGDSDPKRFFIRATQGHSMKGVEAENLLTPISLDDPDSIPDTVVHGTFYGAWSPILQTGGLKSMTRNHVHFATGPGFSEVLPEDTSNSSGKPKGGLAQVMGENKVISGMRSDAQILVYIDIRKALQEDKEMKWWRSENGVILTDGIATDTGGGAKIVPTKYWLAAVEIKEGLGLLWKQGEGEDGVVQELPATLRSRPVPRGKGGGPRGRGGGRGRGRGTEN